MRTYELSLHLPQRYCSISHIYYRLMPVQCHFFALEYKLSSNVMFLGTTERYLTENFPHWNGRFPRDSFFLTAEKYKNNLKSKASFPPGWMKWDCYCWAALLQSHRPLRLRRARACHPKNGVLQYWLCNLVVFFLNWRLR